MRTDKKGNIIISSIRNQFHFDIQRTTRMQIQKDKTKYTRKVKHKNNNLIAY